MFCNMFTSADGGNGLLNGTIGYISWIRFANIGSVERFFFFFSYSVLLPIMAWIDKQIHVCR